MEHPKKYYLYYINLLLMGLKHPKNISFGFQNEVAAGDVQAACANARSLLAAYDAKSERQARMTWRLVHHTGLNAIRTSLLSAAIQSLRSGKEQRWTEDNNTQQQHPPSATTTSTRHFQAAADSCHALASEAQLAIVYMERYDWRILSAAAVWGYAAWMMYLTVQLLLPQASEERRSSGGDLTDRPLRGLSRRMCWLATAVACCLLAFIGAPVRL